MSILSELVIILLAFILLFKNVSFILLFSPVLKFYFCVRNRYVMENNKGNDSETNSTDISVLNRLKSLYSGFADYYLYRLSYTPSHHLRNFVYRHVCGMNLCEGAVIYYGTEVREPSKVTIGRGSIIGDHSILDGRNGIQIGENVVFASDVKIWTEQHDYRDPYFRCSTQKHRPVVIDNRAWIGSHTVILHSVHIGEGAVVAAGAVVTHDVPPFTVFAGIPAKKIGERNHDLRYTFAGEHRHFI